MGDEVPRKNRGPIWIAIIAIVIVAAGLSSRPGRNLGQKFFQSLRVQKVQAVNVDLSSFVGPNANRSLQQMFSQMISDKVTVTVNENRQDASNAATASQIANFQVKLVGARKDTPKLTVVGERAFNLTVDRARLQAIFNEAGRPDLILPQSIDGAAVAVRLPRTVRAQYGSCPGPPSAAVNVATPTPASTQYSDCVILNEGPSPEVSLPPGLDLAQLAQIGLELAGMTPTQAHDFLQTVNWKTILGLPVPRSMRSYEAVEIGGLQGTLLNTAGRRGPTYTLIWVKSGMVYSLTGYGNSGNAAALAESVK